jgi:hypothetical protein
MTLADPFVSRPWGGVGVGRDTDRVQYPRLADGTLLPFGARLATARA